ncbi:hypothetical protein CPLU01_05423 [Colletotrichum plurivorum]|uniref:Uncharacterized protein n=1 Tax=Colletotrichum plurivorum TaxID=2175906 RepID=A0A8H6KL71_9PEZI|nr:hypothetical protein CPLU01_05423 [Colletotrichum plurivorum]
MARVFQRELKRLMDDDPDDTRTHVFSLKQLESDATSDTSGHINTTGGDRGQDQDGNGDGDGGHPAIGMGPPLAEDRVTDATEKAATSTVLPATEHRDAVSGASNHILRQSMDVDDNVVDQRLQRGRGASRSNNVANSEDGFSRRTPGLSRAERKASVIVDRDTKRDEVNERFIHVDSPEELLEMMFGPSKLASTASIATNCGANKGQDEMQPRSGRPLTTRAPKSVTQQNADQLASRQSPDFTARPSNARKRSPSNIEPRPVAAATRPLKKKKVKEPRPDVSELDDWSDVSKGVPWRTEPKVDVVTDDDEFFHTSDEEPILANNAKK